MRLNLITVGVVVLCGLFARLAGAEPVTALLAFDAAKIGPAVSCTGEVRVSDGGKLVLREWLHDGKDSVEGAKFSLTTEQNAKMAEAAKLRVAYRATLPKGLLIEVEAPTAATLSAATSLGEFTVPLARLRSERAVDVLDGKARLEWVPHVVALTGNQAEEEYPSVAAMPDGRAAVAYVAWDGKSDKVFLRLGDETREITEKPGDYMEPRCAVDGQRRLWVIWAANDGEQWDLWARADGAPVKLTSSPRNDFWPRLTRDPRGALWLAWQTAADDLHYEVMLAQLGPDGLKTPVVVSEHAADDWEPALCATPDGCIVVAWDTYRNGSFDVYLREFSAQPDGAAKPLGPPRPVAASAKREAHATVASDSKGRVWLAWDVSMENWGKHPQQKGSLHSYRDTDVACYTDGKLRRLGTEFTKSLPPPFVKFIEYPQIVADGQDRVWVIFRFENEVRAFYKAPKVRIAQNHGMWHLFARQYDGEKWSAPILIARSNGRQDVRVDVARDAKGDLLVAFAADGRTRQFPYMPVDYDVFLASLAGSGSPAREPQLEPAPDLGQVVPASPDPELQPLPRQWTVGGKEYRLLVGDTHRHTDISRCANGYDGSLQDAYRYALDACGLDWLAISDHDQDIMKHRQDKLNRPRQDYDWWRSQKYCDLYTIPNRFVALYGYEHGRTYQKGGGHKNVVAAQRGRPICEEDAQHSLFASLANSGAIAIPHQLADGGSRMDWEKWNTEYERVGEIFQARGSYEFEGCPRAAVIFDSGFSMWDALAKGIRIGIIASSDHGQTHQARAGAYVEGPTGFTRNGILQALRARRAFGATVSVAMQVRAGDNLLGEEITLASPPKIEARVIAPDKIMRMDIVREGKFVYTAEPKTPDAAFAFEDLDLKPGQSAYYSVRAQIGANDFAWSSPIWVKRSE